MNYFISREGTEYGPYTLADLQRYVASGNVLVTDLTRSEAMSEWVPVSQVIGNIPIPAAAVMRPPEPRLSLARDGKKLIIPRGAACPHYCVKCGEPADGNDWKKKFTWCNPWWALLIFAGVFIYLIVYFITRRQMQLSIPLCEEHRDKQRTKSRIGTLLLATSPLVMIVGAIAGKDEVAGFGVLMLPVMLIAGLVVRGMAAPLKARKIDDARGVFAGAGEPFLQAVESQNAQAAVAGY
jgi:drug/metabolite transporter (DMT)-like permease